MSVTGVKVVAASVVVAAGVVVGVEMVVEAAGVVVGAGMVVDTTHPVVLQVSISKFSPLQKLSGVVGGGLEQSRMRIRKLTPQL